MTPLFSPTTRSPLTPAGQNLLRDSDGRYWPVLDGIPFLRVGRDALIAGIVERLQAGDEEQALILALSDQDDWWTGAQPDANALAELVKARDQISLREAMALLAYARVGDYFAHRWSDPTFLSGLALLETHWQPTSSAFELACGIGHYGRELMRRGVAYTGSDVVFSKLWLARHWVLPVDASLVCFDAAAPWPIVNQSFDLVFCHDAFYFLDPKPRIAQSLRGLARNSGRVAVGHIHNIGVAKLSAGNAISVSDIAYLFPGATLYDDAELTAALAEGRAPRAAQPHDLSRVEAISLEDRAVTSARGLFDGLAMPTQAAGLRLNPLYRFDGADYAVTFPSDRYEAEYSDLATYPHVLSSQAAASAIEKPTAEAIRRRIVVDLPDRW